MVGHGLSVTYWKTGHDWAWLDIVGIPWLAASCCCLAIAERGWIWQWLDLANQGLIWLHKTDLFGLCHGWTRLPMDISIAMSGYFRTCMPKQQTKSVHTGQQS